MPTTADQQKYKIEMLQEQRHIVVGRLLTVIYSKIKPATLNEFKTWLKNDLIKGKIRETLEAYDKIKSSNKFSKEYMASSGLLSGRGAEISREILKLNKSSTAPSPANRTPRIVSPASTSATSPASSGTSSPTSSTASVAPPTSSSGTISVSSMAPKELKISPLEEITNSPQKTNGNQRYYRHEKVKGLSFQAARVSKPSDNTQAPPPSLSTTYYLVTIAKAELARMKSKEEKEVIAAATTLQEMGLGLG